MGQVEQPARDVTTEVDGRVLGLTNLDKVMYPETGTTKADVLAYYAAVASVLIPAAANQALARCQKAAAVSLRSSVAARCRPGGSSRPRRCG